MAILQSIRIQGDMQQGVKSLTKLVVHPKYNAGIPARPTMLRAAQLAKT